ncbi:SEL1-like repeat protein [Leisingera aquaemixtae]|uniref:tetratricopeptide repeat protein n=1 Tax=Leisingera aquaemixtae TaxID=1396826 RepID=UPI001C95D8D7|nr:hypothetical protein [Leisingera aquaemixtae]MBY6069022.1 SEL1-like repeat protein [Leisingera aquaemixtae]
MPRFQTLFLLPLLSLPALLPQALQAGDDVQSPAAAALPARPDMAAIEQAWAAGDFVFVRQGLKRHAEETGMPLAQYRYGRVLLEGRGGPADPAAAQGWLEQAVAQNHADAAVLLARLYLSGVPGGPPRDPARAAELLKGAAARGRSEAQYYLGLLHRAGEGAAQSDGDAFTWFLAAAEAGHAGAQFELSRAYSRGLGTAPDGQEALRWLQEAAGTGHAEAQFYLAYALDSGQGAAQDRGQALDWLRRAAEGGFAQAQLALGRKYLKGDGAEANPSEALRWLGTAAAGGSAAAAAELGAALRGRHGVSADPVRAWGLLTQAAEAGLAEAALAMAEMREAGEGGPPDLKQAVALYREAAEMGSETAVLHLGALAGAGRLDGLMAPHRAVPWALAAARAGDAAAQGWLEDRAGAGLRPAQTALGLLISAREDLTEAGADRAAGLFLAAAERGDTEAQHQLGLLHIKGQGVAQDYVQAHKWLNIAAAGGHAKALEMRAVAGDLMTPEQLAEAQAAARVFFEQAAPPEHVLQDAGASQ